MQKPKGRPKGVQNKRTLTAMAIDAYNKKHDTDAVADLLGKLLDMAVNDGDLQAAKMVLDRVEPAYKSILAPVQLPKMPKGLFEKGEKIVSLVSDGSVSPDVGKELLSGIASLMTIKEKTELEERLKKLEDIKNGQ